VTYAVAQDFIDRWGNEESERVSDRANAGAIDTGVIDTALSDASDFMDGFIGVAYDLPLPSVPRVLIQFTCDIAMYDLSTDQGLLTEDKESRRDKAVKTLQAIASNKFKLPLPTTGDPVRGAVTVIGPERQFSRDKLRNV